MKASNERDQSIRHDDVRHYYDNEYYGDSPDHSPLAWHLRSIAGRVEPLAGREVLDIACGTGQWLAEMTSRGASVSGIDISSRAVAQCRERLPGADIREGVAERLPFDDGVFDLVCCLGSLEHFLDQPAALREMRRVAKADARFLILVPNAGFLTRRLGLYGGTGQTAIRETVRSLDDWTGLLSDAGLEVNARWRDLRAISGSWITKGPMLSWPIRAMQALALAVWPLSWQYQVYFLCTTIRQTDSD